MIKRLTLIIITALFSVLAVATPAHAAANDANFKNVGSTYPIYMCRDWATTTCSSSSPKRDLYPGHVTTEFGWSDTDGFYVPSNYDVLRNDGGSWVRYGSTGWKKVSGCFDCTWKLKRVPNGGS